jgi:hypothetical protein
MIDDERWAVSARYAAPRSTRGLGPELTNPNNKELTMARTYKSEGFRNPARESRQLRSYKKTYGDTKGLLFHAQKKIGNAHMQFAKILKMPNG